MALQKLHGKVRYKSEVGVVLFRYGSHMPHELFAWAWKAAFIALSARNIDGTLNTKDHHE